MSLGKGSKDAKRSKDKVGLKTEGGAISIQMLFKAILLDELKRREEVLKTR